jgi:hypothetical protein
MEYNQVRKIIIDKLSQKPQPLKVLVIIITASVILFLLGLATLRGIDLGNRQRCENWKKEKGYKSVYTIGEIKMCETVDIELIQ